MNRAFQHGQLQRRPAQELRIILIKAGQKAVNKYIAKNYDRFNLVFKKDVSPTKEEVQAAADAAGESLNRYIVGAVKQRMETDAAGCVTP